MSKCDIKPLSPTMNPELKQRWLQALRSPGLYEQGRKALRLADKFCCLGVLCDVVMPDAWDELDYTGHGTYSHPWGDPTSELLSDKVLRELKLTEPLQQRLANMNDQGKNFIEIAEVIEAEA